MVRYFIRSVEIDAAADGTAETGALLQRLLGDAGVGSLVKRMTVEPTSGPVVPMPFRQGGTSLRRFTTTLGTPQDITLQALSIECCFAMDHATAQVFRSWPSAASRTVRACQK